MFAKRYGKLREKSPIPKNEVLKMNYDFDQNKSIIYTNQLSTGLNEIAKILNGIPDDEEKANSANYVINSLIKFIMKNLQTDSERINLCRTIIECLFNTINIENKFKIRAEDIINYAKKPVHDIDIAYLATSYYKKAFELDHSQAIRLMGKYLDSARILDKNYRVNIIRDFVGQEWSLEVFKNDLRYFLNSVLVKILKYNMEDEFREAGINIFITEIDKSDEEINLPTQDDIQDDFRIDIIFRRPSEKLGEKISYESFIKNNLSLETMDKIKYYNNKNRSSLDSFLVEVELYQQNILKYNKNLIDKKDRGVV